MDELNLFAIYSSFTQTLMNGISSFLKQHIALVDQLFPEVFHHFSKRSSERSCFRPFIWLVFLESLLRRCIGVNFTLIVHTDYILPIVWARLRAAPQSNGMDALCIIEQWTHGNQISISIDKCSELTYSNPNILKQPHLF